MKCPILKGWDCVGDECRFYDPETGKCLFYRFFKAFSEEIEEEE
jgi:hypothetical protein